MAELEIMTDSNSLRAPKRRQPLRGLGRDRRKAVCRAHNKGWEATQRSTVSRSAARSVTLFQPRQSSQSQIR